MLHFIRLLANEIYIRWILHWYYTLNTVASLLLMIVNFLWLIVLANSGSLAPEQIAPSLVGYIIWAYSDYAIYDFTWNILQEAQKGVLEQMFITPFSFGSVLMARVLSNMVVATIEIGVAALVIMLFWGIPFPLTWGSIPIIIITMIGLYSFALILGGLTLVFKQIQSFATLISWIILYLNGSVASIDKFPVWLQKIAYWLPTTEGIQALQKLVLKQATLHSLWQSGSLTFLILHSVLMLILGTVIFRWSERKARQQGGLGHY